MFEIANDADVADTCAVISGAAISNRS